MANIDAKLLLSDNQLIDNASKQSSAVYVGKGRAANPLVIDVKLTTAFATGKKITAIKVQTASDEAFTTPVDLCTFVPGSAINQEVAGKTLMQLMVPFEHLEYIRLDYAASATPTLGKVFASINKDVKLG